MTLQQDKGPKQTAKTRLEEPQDKCLTVLEWSSQSLELNPQKISGENDAVYRLYPSNLTETERIFQEEGDKLPKSRRKIYVKVYTSCLLLSNELRRSKY